MKKKIYICIIWFVCFQLTDAQPIAYPFMNPQLSFEERVLDLVNRMTLEEKISQMGYRSPAISRLGIPEYNWWSGCTHGVGRVKETVTVYPQSIALAATFNPEEMYRTACQISDEARALHQKAKREGRFGEQYYGLTMWDPNINIFRDPRWGRGHETYGEDPYLTARIGLAFIRGLEGDHPKYLKTSACAKHFAVHSGPEYNRSRFNATVSAYDLWDTYLPAFRQLIVKGNVSSVMCAYNRLEGKPCCGNDLLMRDILRNTFGFTGYSVSDCGAIAFFWNSHQSHQGSLDASVDALLAGTDLECGDEDAYASLMEAVQKGLITEREIDESVKRLFRIRFRLGMFDPDEMVEYAKISETVINGDLHKQQALKMARESIVLLKNEKQLLPLSKQIKKIAVVGPNAHNERTPLANYNGFPEKVITPLEGIQTKLPTAEVIYNEICYPIVNKEELNKIDMKAIVQQVSDAEVIVFVGGLNTDLEGENGDAGLESYDGFRDGDRTTIQLPFIQTQLLKALHATGKPVIFVMMTGSALGIPWEAEHLPAIVNTWYGGQATGEALADVLFGDYNPGGKLPVTFYRSDDDLPHFEDYSMENRTYRYFTKEPLFPFGYGLSYTTFSFDELRHKQEVRTDESVNISIKVTNTGTCAGSEVVQLYVTHKGNHFKVPVRSLAAFEKVYLKAGETQTIHFTLTPEELAVVKEDGRHCTVSGLVEFTVGGQQPTGKIDDSCIRSLFRLTGEEYFVY